MSEGDGNDEGHFLVEKATEITVFLVLGVAFLALGLGYDWFWLVFLVGFAVVLPLVSVVGELLVEVGADGDDESAGEEDALEVLKSQYASGEIDEAEFERRLEILVDADSPAEARDRIERRRASEGTARDRDLELDPE